MQVQDHGQVQPALTVADVTSPLLVGLLSLAPVPLGGDTSALRTE
jgi:hypothetical protein